MQLHALRIHARQEQLSRRHCRGGECPASSLNRRTIPVVPDSGHHRVRVSRWTAPAHRPGRDRELFAGPCRPASERSFGRRVKSRCDEASFDAWVTSPVFAHGHRSAAGSKTSGTSGAGPEGRVAEADHSAGPVGIHSEPAGLDAREDWWALADRAVWAERAIQFRPEFTDLSRRLQLALEPLGPPQLVPADLAGNVLFSPTLPPAVIDISPCWRPSEYAEAVVLADALCWHGAPASLPDHAVSIC